MNKSEKHFELLSLPQLGRDWLPARGMEERIAQFKNNLEGQHHTYLNQTASHDLVLQRIITKLTLLRHEGLAARQDKESPLSSVIDFCTKQLCTLMEGHERLKAGWAEVMRGIPEWPGFQQCSQCRECACNGQARASEGQQKMGLSEQNCAKLACIDYLEVEVEQLELKYEQILQQNKQIKEKCAALELLNIQSANKLQQCNSILHRLEKTNEELTLQLKEARKQAQLWAVRLQATERDNRRLAELQARAFSNERELNKIIDENEREIGRVCEQVHRLNLEVMGFHVKFRQATKERAENQEEVKLKRGDKILCEIPTQNTIDSVQSMISKRELEKMRRNQLQSVQQRLSSYNLLA